MAAKTLTAPTSTNPSEPDRFLGAATADDVRQIDIDQDTRHILIRVVDSNGDPMAFKVATSGTDEDPIGTDFWHSVSGEAYNQTFGNGPARNLGGTTLYVAGDAANPTIETVSSLHGS